MVTDPIADYLTRLRNAVMANHRMVEIPASNIKKEITKILFDKGYILNYKFEDEQFPPAERERIVAHTLLGRVGSPDDIARTVAFLMFDAPYVTGQILAVDGGRSAQL